MIGDLVQILFSYPQPGMFGKLGIVIEVNNVSVDSVLNTVVVCINSDEIFKFNYYDDELLVIEKL